MREECLPLLIIIATAAVLIKADSFNSAEDGLRPSLSCILWGDVGCQKKCSLLCRVFGCLSWNPKCNTVFCDCQEKLPIRFLGVAPNASDSLDLPPDVTFKQLMLVKFMRTPVFRDLDQVMPTVPDQEIEVKKYLYSTDLSGKDLKQELKRRFPKLRYLFRRLRPRPLSQLDPNASSELLKEGIVTEEVVEEPPPTSSYFSSWFQPKPKPKPQPKKFDIYSPENQKRIIELIKKLPYKHDILETFEVLRDSPVKPLYQNICRHFLREGMKSPDGAYIIKPTSDPKELDKKVQSDDAIKQLQEKIDESNEQKKNRKRKRPAASAESSSEEDSQQPTQEQPTSGNSWWSPPWGKGQNPGNVNTPAQNLPDVSQSTAKPSGGWWSWGNGKTSPKDQQSVQPGIDTNNMPSRPPMQLNGQPPYEGPNSGKPWAWPSWNWPSGSGSQDINKPNPLTGPPPRNSLVPSTGTPITTTNNTGSVDLGEVINPSLDSLPKKNSKKVKPKKLQETDKTKNLPEDQSSSEVAPQGTVTKDKKKKRKNPSDSNENRIDETAPPGAQPRKHKKKKKPDENILDDSNSDESTSTEITPSRVQPRKHKRKRKHHMKPEDESDSDESSSEETEIQGTRPKHRKRKQKKPKDDNEISLAPENGPKPKKKKKQSDKDKSEDDDESATEKIPSSGIDEISPSRVQPRKHRKKKLNKKPEDDSDSDESSSKETESPGTRPKRKRRKQQKTKDDDETSLPPENDSKTGNNDTGVPSTKLKKKKKNPVQSKLPSTNDTDSDETSPKEIAPDQIITKQKIRKKKVVPSQLPKQSEPVPIGDKETDESSSEEISPNGVVDVNGNDDENGAEKIPSTGIPSANIKKKKKLMPPTVPLTNDIDRDETSPKEIAPDQAITNQKNKNKKVKPQLSNQSESLPTDDKKSNESLSEEISPDGTIVKHKKKQPKDEQSDNDESTPSSESSSPSSVMPSKTLKQSKNEPASSTVSLNTPELPTESSDESKDSSDILTEYPTSLHSTPGSRLPSNIDDTPITSEPAISNNPSKSDLSEMTESESPTNSADTSMIPEKSMLGDMNTPPVSEEIMTVSSSPKNILPFDNISEVNVEPLDISGDVSLSKGVNGPDNQIPKTNYKPNSIPFSMTPEDSMNLKDNQIPGASLQKLLEGMPSTPPSTNAAAAEKVKPRSGIFSSLGSFWSSPEEPASSIPNDLASSKPISEIPSTSSTPSQAIPSSLEDKLIPADFQSKELSELDSPNELKPPSTTSLNKPSVPSDLTKGSAPISAAEDKVKPPSGIFSSLGSFWSSPEEPASSTPNDLASSKPISEIPTISSSEIPTTTSPSSQAIPSSLEDKLIPADFLPKESSELDSPNKLEPPSTTSFNKPSVPSDLTKGSAPISAAEDKVKPPSGIFSSLSSFWSSPEEPASTSPNDSASSKLTDDIPTTSSPASTSPDELASSESISGTPTTSSSSPQVVPSSLENKSSSADSQPKDSSELYSSNELEPTSTITINNARVPSDLTKSPAPISTNTAAADKAKPPSEIFSSLSSFWSSPEEPVSTSPDDSASSKLFDDISTTSSPASTSPDEPALSESISGTPTTSSSSPQVIPTSLGNKSIPVDSFPKESSELHSPNKLEPFSTKSLDKSNIPSDLTPINAQTELLDRENLFNTPSNANSPVQEVLSDASSSSKALSPLLKKQNLIDSNFDGFSNSLLANDTTSEEIDHEIETPQEVSQLKSKTIPRPGVFNGGTTSPIPTPGVFNGGSTSPIPRPGVFNGGSTSPMLSNFKNNALKNPLSQPVATSPNKNDNLLLDSPHLLDSTSDGSSPVMHKGGRDLSDHIPGFNVPLDNEKTPNSSPTPPNNSSPLSIEEVKQLLRKNLPPGSMPNEEKLQELADNLKSGTPSRGPPSSNSSSSPSVEEVKQFLSKNLPPGSMPHDEKLKNLIDKLKSETPNSGPTSPNTPSPSNIAELKQMLSKNLPPGSVPSDEKLKELADKLKSGSPNGGLSVPNNSSPSNIAELKQMLSNDLPSGSMPSDEKLKGLVDKLKSGTPNSGPTSSNNSSPPSIEEVKQLLSKNLPPGNMPSDEKLKGLVDKLKSGIPNSGPTSPNSSSPPSIEEVKHLLSKSLPPGSMPGDEKLEGLVDKLKSGTSSSDLSSNNSSPPSIEEVKQLFSKNLPPGSMPSDEKLKELADNFKSGTPSGGLSAPNNPSPPNIAELKQILSNDLPPGSMPSDEKLKGLIDKLKSGPLNSGPTSPNNSSPPSIEEVKQMLSKNLPPGSMPSDEKLKELADKFKSGTPSGGLSAPNNSSPPSIEEVKQLLNKNLPPGSMPSDEKLKELADKFKSGTPNDDLSAPNNSSPPSIEEVKQLLSKTLPPANMPSDEKLKGLVDKLKSGNLNSGPTSPNTSSPTNTEEVKQLLSKTLPPADMPSDEKLKGLVDKLKSGNPNSGPTSPNTSSPTNIEEVKQLLSKNLPPGSMPSDEKLKELADKFKSGTPSGGLSAPNNSSPSKIAESKQMLSNDLPPGGIPSDEKLKGLVDKLKSGIPNSGPTSPNNSSPPSTQDVKQLLSKNLSPESIPSDEKLQELVDKPKLGNPPFNKSTSMPEIPSSLLNSTLSKSPKDISPNSKKPNGSSTKDNFIPPLGNSVKSELNAPTSYNSSLDNTPTSKKSEDLSASPNQPTSNMKTSNTVDNHPNLPTVSYTNNPQIRDTEPVQVISSAGTPNDFLQSPKSSNVLSKTPIVSDTSVPGVPQTPNSISHTPLRVLPSNLSPQNIMNKTLDKISPSNKPKISSPTSASLSTIPSEVDSKTPTSESQNTKGFPAAVSSSPLDKPSISNIFNLSTGAETISDHLPIKSDHPSTVSPIAVPKGNISSDQLPLNYDSSSGTGFHNGPDVPSPLSENKNYHPSLTTNSDTPSSLQAIVNPNKDHLKNSSNSKTLPNAALSTNGSSTLPQNNPVSQSGSNLPLSNQPASDIPSAIKSTQASPSKTLGNIPINNDYSKVNSSPEIHGNVPLNVKDDISNIESDENSQPPPSHQQNVPLSSLSPILVPTDGNPFASFLSTSSKPTSNAKNPNKDSPTSSSLEKSLPVKNTEDTQNSKSPDGTKNLPGSPPSASNSKFASLLNKLKNANSNPPKNNSNPLAVIPNSDLPSSNSLNDNPTLTNANQSLPLKSAPSTVDSLPSNKVPNDISSLRAHPKDTVINNPSPIPLDNQIVTPNSIKNALGSPLKTLPDKQLGSNTMASQLPLGGQQPNMKPLNSKPSFIDQSHSIEPDNVIGGGSPPSDSPANSLGSSTKGSPLKTLPDEQLGSNTMASQLPLGGQQPNMKPLNNKPSFIDQSHSIEPDNRIGGGSPPSDSPVNSLGSSSKNSQIEKPNNAVPTSLNSKPQSPVLPSSIPNSITITPVHPDSFSKSTPSNPTSSLPTPSTSSPTPSPTTLPSMPSQSPSPIPIFTPSIPPAHSLPQDEEEDLLPYLDDEIDVSDDSMEFLHNRPKPSFKLPKKLSSNPLDLAQSSGLKNSESPTSVPPLPLQVAHSSPRSHLSTKDLDVPKNIPMLSPLGTRVGNPGSLQNLESSPLQNSPMTSPSSQLPSASPSSSLNNLLSESQPTDLNGTPSPLPNSSSTASQKPNSLPLVSPSASAPLQSHNSPLQGLNALSPGNPSELKINLPHDSSPTLPKPSNSQSLPPSTSKSLPNEPTSQNLNSISSPAATSTPSTPSPIRNLPALEKPLFDTKKLFASEELPDDSHSEENINDHDSEYPSHSSKIAPISSPTSPITSSPLPGINPSVNPPAFKKPLFDPKKLFTSEEIPDDLHSEEHINGHESEYPSHSSKTAPTSSPSSPITSSPLPGINPSVNPPAFNKPLFDPKKLFTSEEIPDDLHSEEHINNHNIAKLSSSPSPVTSSPPPVIKKPMDLNKLFTSDEVPSDLVSEEHISPKQLPQKITPPPPLFSKPFTNFGQMKPLLTSPTSPPSPSPNTGKPSIFANFDDLPASPPSFKPFKPLMLLSSPKVNFDKPINFPKSSPPSSQTDQSLDDAAKRKNSVQNWRQKLNQKKPLEPPS